MAEVEAERMDRVGSSCELRFSARVRNEAAVEVSLTGKCTCVL